MLKATEKENSTADATRKDYHDVANRFHDMRINEKWLPSLQSTHQKLTTEKAHKSELLSGLKTASDTYQRAAPVAWKSQRLSKLFFILSILAFTFAALFWVIWGTLNLIPESPQAVALSSWLESTMPSWKESLQPLLQPAAWVFSGLFALMLFGVWRMNLKADRFAYQAKGLLDDLDKIETEFGKGDVTFPARVAKFFRKKGIKPVEHDYRVLLGELASLKDGVAALRATPARVQEMAAQVEGETVKREEEIGQHAKVLDKEIAREKKRLTHANGLKKIQVNLNRKLNDHQHKVNVNETAVSLLEAASHHLSHRFNQEVLMLAGEALPVFTQGRYKHLKIDENLDVRVFSNEKRDFMDFDETSSGTQRQIMLSLRLAMTQELIKNIEAGRQFIFFDEPFAFFDQQRIRNTLEQLPNISEDIAQIWLVAQEFPEGTVADYAVQCEQGLEELITP